MIQAYSPLTRGERLDDSILERIAAAHSKTPSQILLRWNIQLGIVPIVKAGNPTHIKEGIDIFDFELSDQDMDKLRSLNEEYSALGELQYLKH